jgi:hypothetical protein
VKPVGKPNAEVPQKACFMVIRAVAGETATTTTGDIYFHIQRQIQSWEKQDDPPTRVKPIPIQVLMVIISLAFSDHPVDASQAIADTTIITFFYLLRPGEYTCTTSDDATFRLCDLQLWIGNLGVPIMTPPVEQLLAITSASLVFTTQKNGVRE